MGSAVTVAAVRSRANRAIRGGKDDDMDAFDTGRRNTAIITTTNGYNTKKFPKTRYHDENSTTQVNRVIVIVAVCGCVVVIFAFAISGLVEYTKFRLTIQQSSTLKSFAYTNISSDMTNTEPVHDFTRHTTADSIEYDYDVPISTIHMERLPDPMYVRPYPNQRLVILVLSHRNHYDRRTIIRQTWGKAYAQSMIFVIGGSNSSKPMVRMNDSSTTTTKLQQEQQLLIKEQELYHDLLDTLHPESYRSLPHKLRYAIHWVVTTCGSTTQWILKVDDDTYLRDLQLYNTTTSPSSGEQTTVPIVMGCIQYNTPVQRHGKWAEDVSFYERYPIYPPWPKGSCGYLFNHALANILTHQYNHDIKVATSTMIQQPQSPTLSSNLKRSDDGRPIASRHRRGQRFDSQLPLLLPSYQGEDTSLGIWLQHSNVTWIDSPFFVNHGDCNILHTLPRNQHNNRDNHTTLTAPKTATGVYETRSMMDNQMTMIDVVVPWSIGHKMSMEQIQYCFDVESETSKSYNNWIPALSSPFDTNGIYSRMKNDTQIDRIHRNNSSSSSTNDVAMMHQSVDQSLVRRRQETQQRIEQRNRRREQQKLLST